MATSSVSDPPVYDCRTRLFLGDNYPTQGAFIILVNEMVGFDDNAKHKTTTTLRSALSCLRIYHIVRAVTRQRVCVCDQNVRVLRSQRQCCK